MERLKLSGRRITAGRHSGIVGFNEDENRGISSDGGVPMGLSSFSYICITNNPALKGLVKHLEYMDASSLDVLKKGRALVHEGWELLASPFYGNFKPNQQPYRTLVLRKNNGGNGGLPDAQSLSLIEDSVRFYENSHWIMPPGRLADNIEKDFRYMDMILLEETFRQYGILTSPVKSYSEVVDK